MKASASMEELKDMLIQKGIQPSFHRLKILDYLLGHRTHPTAEEVYQALSPEIPTLSRTTVYNTLKLFYQKGLLLALTIEDLEIRYDIDTTPHGHFKCLKCGRVYDLSFHLSPAQTSELEGHQVLEYHIYFRGICKACRQETTPSGDA